MNPSSVLYRVNARPSLNYGLTVYVSIGLFSVALGHKAKSVL